MYFILVWWIGLPPRQLKSSFSADFSRQTNMKDAASTVYYVLFCARICNSIAILLDNQFECIVLLYLIRIYIGWTITLTITIAKNYSYNIISGQSQHSIYCVIEPRIGHYLENDSVYRILLLQ